MHKQNTAASPEPAPVAGPGEVAESGQVAAAATTEERWLNDVFTYHPPTDADRAAYMLIREAAKTLVKTIKQNTPKCADQTAAIRKVREAVMTANAARALRGLV